MKFGILGTLVAVRDGRELDLGRPKQRAVLAALLIDRGRVVSLDRLADQLWADQEVSRATASLRAYVSNLRRVLDPERGPRAPCQVLLTQAPGYRLQVDAGELDAACFESLAAEGRRFLDDGRTHQAVEALVEALAVWRGPALAEFAFEEFARSAAIRLDELRAITVEDRIDAELTLGRRTVAIAELEALVVESPLRERLWELLMVAMYQAGRQADALRAFSAARDVLAEELGIAPGPALRRLEADILAQSPSLEWRAPHRRPVAKVGPPPPSDIAVSATSLVGRHRELKTLMVALGDVIAGRARVALVSGEPGIGKTRLVEELAGRAGDTGALVVWARCEEAEGAPPYWPWIQVIKAVLAHAEPDVVRRALDGVAGELAQIVPDVKELVVDVVAPPSLDPASARFSFRRAMVEFVRGVAEAGPMVIVVDDLQWADVASLDLVRHVAAELDRDAVLLVVAYRDIDPGVSGPLADVLGVLARHRALDRVMLEGLAEPDVGRFIAQTADVEPTPMAVAAVHARTEGNPFFVGELARLLVSTGLLNEPSADLVADVAVPVGVRDVIRGRLARLPQATNDLLRVAAVIGREFDVAVLAQAGDVEQGLALDHVDVAAAAGIVREDPARVGWYAFSHALVRDTVWGESSASRLARVHARVGDALESLGDPERRVAELASHFFRAAPAIGPRKGIGYALRAAEAARAAFAYERAEEELRRALELVEQMPPGVQRDGLELEAQNALAALLVMTRGYGDPDVGLACARARALCDQVGETDQLFATLWASASFHSVRGDFGLLEQLGEQFLAIGHQQSSSMWLMAGFFAVGHAQFCTGRLVEADANLSEARQLAPSLELSVEVADRFIEHPRVVVTIYSSCVVLLLGDPQRAAELDHEAVGVARSLGHPFTLAFAYLGSTQLAVLAGDAPLAQTRAEAGIAVCEQARIPSFGVLALHPARVGSRDPGQLRGTA